MFVLKITFSSSSPLVLLCSYADLFPHWFYVCVFDGLLGLFPGFIKYAVCSGLNPNEKKSVHVYGYCSSERTSVILQIAYLLIFQQGYVLTPVLLQT